MKNIIKKILKEDFDWAIDIPSFIEITEPVTQDNPKDVFRLHWTNEHWTGDYGVWADNWYNFNNDSDGVDRLVRYIKIIENGLVDGEININLLVDLYLNQGYDYIATDWMKNELSKTPDEEKEDVFGDMLRDDLYDLDLFSWDSSVTIERWRVTYFDEHGVEFKTKINMV
jgi:hypothetical protein